MADDMTTPSEDEILARYQRNHDPLTCPFCEAARTIERHRAEIEELRAEADRGARRAGQSAAEVERLTRERDEARELAGEAKCKNCGSPIAKCQQCRREGYITCCPECDHESAESTLAAAQKRAKEEMDQQYSDWSRCCAMNGACGASVAEIRLERKERAALAGKEPDNG